MARPGNVRIHLTFGVFTVLLLALPVLTGCAHSDPPLVLATTTSVANSGLLDRVIPKYDSPSPVRPLLVGSGRALEMLANRTADVVISHAPARERTMLDAHPAWWYRKILFNDFLIVGPSEDPAGVRTARDAVDAMRRIAASTATFISRGDESGTHERERELWTAAGGPPDARRLVVAGAGMGQTLRIASSTGAYTLTDRGTYEALHSSTSLAVVHEGDTRLLNTYAVIADPGNARGMRFARWLAEGAGLDVMTRELERNEVRGFSIWPRGRERSSPEATPR